MERGNGKTARAGCPALTAAKDRLKGAQWVPGDLAVKSVEVADLKGIQ